MENDPFEKKYEDSKYISGIYNYCDRWCERCAFTVRCLNFEMSAEKFGDLQGADLNNEEFWKRLGETLQETLKMVQEMAAEKGIDLDALDTEEESGDRKSFDEKDVVHMTTHLAKSYITRVDDWLDANIFIYESAADAPETDRESGLATPRLQEDAITLKGSVEVIQWYQHQIYIKLKRAVHSTQDIDFEIENNFPKDSDGSAKVALIGMDRSISAWGKLLNYFTDQEQEILNIIAHLERLRTSTENEFPEARAFVRPGFDEIPAGRRSSA